jgi:hypothetical protein
MPATDTSLIRQDEVVSVDNLMIQDASAFGASCTYIYPQQPGGSVAIYFGVLEQGVPVAFSCINPGGTYTTVTANSNSPYYVPLGRGFEGLIHFVGANTYTGANHFKGNSYLRWDRQGFSQTSYN